MPVLIVHVAGRETVEVIRCAPEVAGLLISGGFQLADTDYVLATVQEILPVDVTLRTRWWVMVTPRGNAVSNAS